VRVVFFHMAPDEVMGALRRHRRRPMAYAI
jgi:hypothetical protein